MELKKITRPAPAIKPVENLNKLLLLRKPKNCVIPSINVGNIINTENKIKLIV